MLHAFSRVRKYCAEARVWFTWETVDLFGFPLPVYFSAVGNRQAETVFRAGVTVITVCALAALVWRVA